jgi:hypothetical protein
LQRYVFETCCVKALKTLYHTQISMWYFSWLRHYTTGWKDPGSIFDNVIWFLNWSNSSSCIMALRLTQSLTEMSKSNHLVAKRWPTHKAHNLTAICEPIVSKVWESWPLTILWASTASCKNSVAFYPTQNSVSFPVICLFQYNSPVSMATQACYQAAIRKLSWLGRVSVLYM